MNKIVHGTKLLVDQSDVRQLVVYEIVKLCVVQMDERLYYGQNTCAICHINTFPEPNEEGGCVTAGAGPWQQNTNLLEFAAQCAQVVEAAAVSSPLN